MALHRELTGHAVQGGAAANVERHRRQGPAPLILSHGFTQNARCWGRFGERLAEHRTVIAVDAPGHGRSEHDKADLDEAARLLGEAGGPGIHIGYSMGGRVALHLALARPELVRGLVLIGATAGIDEAEGRADRRRADAALADRLMDEGLGQFLDRWLAGPLFADLTDEQAGLDARLTNRAEGLAASLRNCGTGTQEPLWSRLAELTMPVMIVVGDRDPKFTAIGQRLLAALTGSAATLCSLPAGHAVHLEQPDVTAEAIIDTINRW